MNGYSDNILKQFKVKRGRLHYLRGPLAGKPAGNKHPNGKIFVRFNGVVYAHDDLLFLYNEQLNGVNRESIDIKEPTKYQTISGYQIFFYTDKFTAPPYVVHGAILINNLWHACQWTDKGDSSQPEYSLCLHQENNQ